MEVREEQALTNIFICSLILALVVIYLVRRFLKNKEKYPPGPTGLPIIGYLPFIRKNAHLKLVELGKKYGGIFSFYLGNQYTVVLTDYPSVKEGLNNPALLARPPLKAFDVLDELDVSNIALGGKYWIEQRRFILHVLRDLGLGKNKMEEYIKEEILYFMKEMKNYNGKPFVPNEILSPSVSNIICFLIFGKRLEYKSEERRKIDDCLNTFSSVFGQSSVLMFMPWLKPIMILTGLLNFKKLAVAMKYLSYFLEKEIERHEKTLDENNIRDYIDSYLVELKKREEFFNSYFSKSMMKRTVQMLLGAGSRTILETLNWAFLIMAKFQDVQKRVHHEIDNVIGKQRQLIWADHAKLPYIQAVLYEIQRWRTIIPLNLLRYAMEDTTIRGYEIPKGTFIMTNIWAVNNDVEYWKDPEVFRPERFLDETGTKIVRHDLYIPFSLGKMSCVGESLAKTETFLYFSNVMQQFTIKPREGEDLDMEGTLGLSYVAKPQKLHFIQREE